MSHKFLPEQKTPKLLSNRKRKWAILWVLLIPLGYFLYPVSLQELNGQTALTIYSRERVLFRQNRQYQTGSYQSWLSLKKYPKFLIRALIIAEDKRFFYHPGFDIVAMMRAMADNLSAGRIVAGGSTISQQLARIILADPLPGHSLFRKIRELFYACKLELYFSKEQILTAYLNRVPLRYNRIGINSAAIHLFSRDVRFLSQAEILSLVVLIRQPNSSQKSFLIRIRHLARRLNLEVKEQELLKLFQKIRNGTKRHRSKYSFLHHYSNWLHQQYGRLNGSFYSTISLEWNGKILAILKNELKFLQKRHVSNGGVIVLKNKPNLQLLAMIGSQKFSDSNNGQVNATTAIRSAGSSLKPFLFALALDRKLYRTYDILADTPARIHGYAPRNNDERYWGRVSFREALANSRNIPAVRVLERVGLENFYQFLQKAGLQHLDRGHKYYGPGLVLGSGGISLLDLARLYSVFLNQGTLKKIYIGRLRQEKYFYGRTILRILKKDSMVKITNILADSEIRKRGYGKRNFLNFPYPIAVKTGTSDGYRDSWTVGYWQDYVVAVWVGNFDGQPADKVSGGVGAARIFHQVVRLLVQNQKPKFKLPRGYHKIPHCRISGQRAGTNCPHYPEVYSIHERLAEVCRSNHNQRDSMVQLLSPQPQAVYYRNPLLPESEQAIPLQVSCSQSVDTRILLDKTMDIAIECNQKQSIKLATGDHMIQLYIGGKLYQQVEFSIRQ